MYTYPKERNETITLDKQLCSFSGRIFYFQFFYYCYVHIELRRKPRATTLPTRWQEQESGSPIFEQGNPGTLFVCTYNMYRGGFLCPPCASCLGTQSSQRLCMPRQLAQWQAKIRVHSTPAQCAFRICSCSVFFLLWSQVIPSVDRRQTVHVVTITETTSTSLPSPTMTSTTITEQGR